MKTFKEFREVSEGFLKTALIGASLIPAGLALAKRFFKPKTDKMLDKQRKTNKIGGDRRSGNTEFQQGANAIKDAIKTKKGIRNPTTKEFENNPEYKDFFN